MKAEVGRRWSSRMVLAFHRAGIAVILDVVLNHTADVGVNASNACSYCVYAELDVWMAEKEESVLFCVIQLWRFH